MTFRGHTRSSKTDGLIVKPGHVNCIVSGCSPTTIAQSKNHFTDAHTSRKYGLDTGD